MTGPQLHSIPPHEDLEREPDGIPHVVVAMTVGVAALFAIAVLGMVVVTSWPVRIASLALFAFAVVVVVRIARRSSRDRDRVHPSL